MAELKNQYWTNKEVQYLQENVGKIPMQEIYQHFETRTKMSVDAKLRRMRLQPLRTVNPERVPRNLVVEMLKHRIGDPYYFTPDKAFYKRVKIRQKRFWQLFRGEVNLTEVEYRTLVEEWNVSLTDAFEMRQISLFND